MMVKVFQSNANGKIEFTREELEKLLNEIYKAGHDTGYSEGKSNQWTWTSPYNLSTSISTTNLTNSTDHSSAAIDNLTCNGAAEVAKLITPVSKSEDSLTNIGSTGYAVANALDEIISEFLKEQCPNPSKNLAPNGCIEASTPHAKLEKELRGL